MNKSTANKDKAFEEPKKTIFILLSNNSEDLLATMFRLQMIKIELADENSLSNFLQKNIMLK